MSANTPTGPEFDLFDDIAQTERIGLGDLIIALVLGAATWILLSLWGFPGVYPSVWKDAVVAAGVQPAAHVMPGYFVAIATLVYDFFGIDKGESVLRILGQASLSGAAVVVYAALREMLAFIMRARPQRSKRRSLVMQIASIVGTVAFVCSDPVWTTGQCLSETSVLIALTILSLEFFFVFLRKGSLCYAYLCALFLGLLCAESPIGFVLLGAFLLVNGLVLKLLPILESPFFKPAVIAVSKWYMTFIFILALLLGIGIDCWSYVAHDGLIAADQGMGELLMTYLLDYSARVSTAASMPGWILWLACCLAPFIVSIIRFPAAADEETFLPYSTGIVFIFCALVAISQSCPIPALWFWTHCPVHSAYMLSFGAIMTATTLAASVTILGVDAICRNHQRLARQQFGQDDEDEEYASDAIDDSLDSPISTAFRRMVIVVLPAVIIAIMVPSRYEGRLRETLSVIRDYVRETVREAGDAEYLFTDGNLDAGIELESARQGGKLKCLPLVGGSSKRDVYLRTRGMENDSENLFSFRFDVGMGLRTWIRDKPGNLSKSAVQMGFDLWKRDGKAVPPMGGVLSRPDGWSDEADRQAGIDTARVLAKRLLAVYEMRDSGCSETINNYFLSVQWRLSRMCTYRSEAADLAGKVEEAIAEADMAKTLNGKNETYKSVLAAMSAHNDMMMQRLTPREGLQLALVRADFTMGKLYSETILQADPENPDANFAMGMYYQKERQLSRAEEYLKRCLIRRPNEPAVYNNLAMIQLELGKLEPARLNAEKALKMIPESAAVQGTVKSIREAIEARKNKDKK